MGDAICLDSDRAAYDAKRDQLVAGFFDLLDNQQGMLGSGRGDYLAATNTNFSENWHSTLFEIVLFDSHVLAIFHNNLCFRCVGTFNILRGVAKNSEMNYADGSELGRLVFGTVQARKIRKLKFD